MCNRFVLFTVILFLVILAPDTSLAKEISLRKQYKNTMADLKLLQVAVNDYILDNEKAPEANTIRELLDQDIGNGLSFADFYLDRVPADKVPSKDAWGNEFLYQAKDSQFYLASPGSKGIFLGFEQQGFYLFSKKELDGKNIIFSETGMVHGPMKKKVEEKNIEEKQTE